MSITILNPGMLTSVQDLGRIGYQQFGVSVSGVMDPRSASITGEEVEIAAHSICVHGDNPSAVEFVKNIRTQLTARGVEIAPIREIV